MKIISERSEIEDCQKILIDNLIKNLTKPLGRTIKISNNTIHNDYLWFAYENNVYENHYWNSFGLIKSHSKEDYNIIAEINSPKEGISRPPSGSSGVFAEDKDEKRYILHRGNFKKGHQHINILQWWRENNYDICELDDGQEAILISSLELEDGSSLVDNITLFVERVHDFKENQVP